MILLPSASKDWPVAEVKAILLHERAHFVRRDHLVGSMVDAAVVLYWLNPIVWLAVAILERHRERACDDEVLQTGVKPSVNAAALMRVAFRLPEPTNIRGNTHDRWRSTHGSDTNNPV
jgi:beta-lactamase regulating signal transducer with metallopeptidase domain